MMFVFPLCSRQKPWATGVRTLKIRPTGRRCSSPPKRVAARSSLCFCLNVSVLVEPGGCLFGRSACLRRASRVGGVIFFPLALFSALSSGGGGRGEAESFCRFTYNNNNNNWSLKTPHSVQGNIHKLNRVRANNKIECGRKEMWILFFVSSFLTQLLRHSQIHEPSS